MVITPFLCNHVSPAASLLALASQRSFLHDVAISFVLGGGG
jgi:hypothetical protein